MDVIPVISHQHLVSNSLPAEETQRTTEHPSNPLPYSLVTAFQSNQASAAANFQTPNLKKIKIAEIEDPPVEISDQQIVLILAKYSGVSWFNTVKGYLLAECQKRHLCALQLVSLFYTEEEMTQTWHDGRNKNQTKSLESGRLHLIKELVGLRWPSQIFEERWREIVKKIKIKCRGVRNKK